MQKSLSLLETTLEGKLKRLESENMRIREELIEKLKEEVIKMSNLATTMLSTAVESLKNMIDRFMPELADEDSMLDKSPAPFYDQTNGTWKLKITENGIEDASEEEKKPRGR
jgi:Na+/phosphate symporter